VVDSDLPTRLALARDRLEHHFGYPEFRPAQGRVIQSVLAGRDALAVLPTGAGKSVCFQIPALVLEGFTVVVSPLISLMQDQVQAALARGIPAALLNSTLDRGQQQSVLGALHDGAIRLLYVSPERLDRLAGELRGRNLRPKLLAVDEAHCIAEWGHDFRPSYRQLRRARYRLGQPPVVALTGSATPRVRADIVDSLGFSTGRRGFDTHLASFDRPNLWFGVHRVKHARDRLRLLQSVLDEEDRMAIVYAPTRNVTEGITRGLIRFGYRAAAYHAGVSKEQRHQVLERFLGDQVEVIVATSAFGMGIDKPTVRLVVHWTLPPTMESYYQEAGRAGRDGALSRCVLLHRTGDARLHRRQLEVTFPPPRVAEQVWRMPGGRIGVPENVLRSVERLRNELRPEEGPVDWSHVLARRRHANARLRAMERYATARSCRRGALLRYFGERLIACSGCDRCREVRPGRPPLTSPHARQRMRRLTAAVGSRRAPWGGQLLSGGTLRALAEAPPGSVDGLASFPGVGPVVAERLSGTILTALGIGQRTDEARLVDPVCTRLLEWRDRTARRLGVPPYVVMPEAVVRRIAESVPRGRAELSRVPGVGPRCLMAFGDEIVSLCSTE
jgi:ATP-dependent DNA helicase RecQ